MLRTPILALTLSTKATLNFQRREAHAHFRRKNPLHIWEVRVKSVGRENIGSIVGAVFGGLWFYYAALLIFPRYQLIDAAVSIALAAMFGIVSLSRAHSSASGLGTDSGGNRTAPTFTIIVIAEIVLINVAWNVLRAMHRPEYLVAAVAIVVGLHFFPFARVFRNRVYYVPAIVMTGAGLLAALTLWNAVACLCCALALWTAVALRPSGGSLVRLSARDGSPVSAPAGYVESEALASKEATCGNRDLAHRKSSVYLRSRRPP